MRKRYKIGEFAKNLGVSPGFLKHHESYGLLKPFVAESGYRYYEFPHAMQVFQCLRMQSMGISSKEISDIMNHSTRIDISSIFKGKTAEIRKKAALYQEILQYMEDAFGEEDVLGDSVDDWTIEVPPPFYYLENAKSGEFFGSEEHFEVAEKWNEYMPLVEVGSRFAWKEGEEPYSMDRWYMGLSISRRTGDRLCVFQNAAVQSVRLGKCLVYHYRGNKIPQDNQALVDAMMGVPLEICRKHGFKPAGDAYLFQTFASTVAGGSFIRERVMIPIEEV